MIHAYPPGARFPKNRSVTESNSPSIVALIAGPETGHGRPTLRATVERGPSAPMTTLAGTSPWLVTTSGPSRTLWTAVSVRSSAPSATAWSAIAWSILSRRTVYPRKGTSQCRPAGLHSRRTSVSTCRTRSGASMRSSSSPTVGKIDRTSSFFATYSPHWTGTPTSFRRSSRRTLSPRRAAYRAAVEPAGPAPTTTRSYVLSAPSGVPGQDELDEVRHLAAGLAVGEGS